MSGNNYPFNIPPLHHSYVLPPSFLPPTMPPNLPAMMPHMMPEQAWVEYVAQDGRPYYHNLYTKQSTWEKPDEFKTRAEKIISECPWKEFPSESGKIYYYNNNTKLSVWSKPAELIEAETEAYGHPLEPQQQTVKEEESVPAMPAVAAEEEQVNAIDEAIKATLGSYMSSTERAAKVSEKDSGSSSGEEGGRESGEVKTDCIPVPQCPSYQTKEEIEEGWRQLLRDMKVPGNCSWESAVKLVSGDVRYQELKKYNQKKQVFNTYKTQRQKEEREEGRLRVKKAKEDLEHFVFNHPKLSSAIGYRKADSLLGSCPEWTAVPERDRREIYDDVLIQMHKREKEESKVLRKRNIKLFEEILNEMPNLTYKTTWYEAQRILLENPRFVDDEDLQSMDKEDALICFEDHIKVLEKDREEEKDREKRRLKRQQRKNRESFNVFLDELHEKSKLTSLSMWKDLYPLMSLDSRFYKMLSQPGSTPLDLFKFYVLGLKSRYSREKRVVKELLAARGHVVTVGSSLEQFLEAVSSEERGRRLDQGNVRMTYNSLLEKAESAEKARRREQARETRRVEQNFIGLLAELVSEEQGGGGELSWEEVCRRAGHREEFLAVPLESERMKLYREHLLAVSSSRSSTSKRGREQQQPLQTAGAVSSLAATGATVALGNSEERDSKRSKKRRRSVSAGDSGEGEGEDGGGGEKRKRGGDTVARSSKRRSDNKKSKKKKRKKRRHRQESSWSSPEEEAEEGEAVERRQPSEGEVIDDDDVPDVVAVVGASAKRRSDDDDDNGTPAVSPMKRLQRVAVKGRRSLSSGEMSENELEAEKSKLLAQLQN